MLSSQIYIEFTEKCLSVLKFKELLKQPALFSSSLSVKLSDGDEMWFEKDMVKDNQQGCVSENTILCIVHA